MLYFWQYGSAAILYIIHSTISLLSDNYTSCFYQLRSVSLELSCIAREFCLSFTACLGMCDIFVCAAEDDQEGVMDNLLEALKTGSAFNVNRERKEGRRRAPRAAGGLSVLLSNHVL